MLYIDTDFLLSILQEANGCDDEIQDLRGHQVELSQQLEDKQVNVQHLQGNSDTLDGDIERLFENKQKVTIQGSILFLPLTLMRRWVGFISCNICFNDVLEMFFIIPQVYWIQII